jgi:hypothetical protein
MVVGNNMSNIAFSLGEHVELSGDEWPTIPVCTVNEKFIARLQELAKTPVYGISGDIDNINNENPVEVIDLAYSNGRLDGKISLANELLGMLGI